ncbi:hypothetical protein TrLO_g4542 [Triparma laevis f. longispina]|uniref:4-coumarate--CoA ligase n=1 Tax=Triparma laevis f. longispina TaxID=1714387 RepID=A0A9W7DLW4_9STRA|nr:hypothetical protein TrLO_g4542 [Triparma laevis f. longispina]
MLSALNFLKKSNPRYVMTCSRALSSNIQQSPFGGLDAAPTELLSDYISKDWAKVESQQFIYEGITNSSLTYKQLTERTANFAASMADEVDVTIRTTATVFSPNHIDYLPLVAGFLRAGGIVSPANPLYTEYELRGQIEKSKSTILIAHPMMLETAMKAVEGTGIRKVIVLGGEDGGVAGAVPFDSLAGSHANPIMVTPDYVKKSVSAADLALLPFSSGTTGLPKGTMLSHQNITINLQQFEHPEGKFMSPNSTLISPLPMFHIYGFTASLLHTAKKSNTLVTMANFDLPRFCELVQEFKPERAHLVPPIILGIAKHPIIDNYDFSSLKMVISAAAPLGAEVEAGVRERLNIGCKQAWGMSELSPVGTVTPDDNLKSGSGTIGPVVAGSEGKIVDLETGEALPPGENNTGELCIRGPQVMMGYLDEPDKTRECLTEDGWLHTGDIAYVDEDGYYFIVDRLKELIKYKGFQVAPAELEAVINTNPKVADCAVIPVEDEQGGEVPRAYAVKSGDIDDEELLTYVEERVSPHKKLRGGVVWVDEIPKSTAGKILRRVVIDMDRAS